MPKKDFVIDFFRAFAYVWPNTKVCVVICMYILQVQDVWMCWVLSLGLHLGYKFHWHKSEAHIDCACMYTEGTELSKHRGDTCVLAQSTKWQLRLMTYTDACLVNRAPFTRAEPRQPSLHVCISGCSPRHADNKTELCIRALQVLTLSISIITYW